jgi:hypothetical protein
MDAVGGHDLVVGGSGMLAGLCARLAIGGRAVTVLARDRDRLDRLKARVPEGRLHGMSVDYRDGRELDLALHRAVAAHGAIERAICWVHDEVAPEAPLRIAAHVHRRFHHVLGSASADPSAPDGLAASRRRFVGTYPSLAYQAIVLGFVVEAGGRSRWLTNAEISDGVHAALSGGEVEVVGVVSPWPARP